MERGDRILEEMEDDFALFLARMQSRRCHNLARAHAEVLQLKAMVAVTAGEIETALWYSERQFEFSCRAFGISNPYSKAIMRRLNTLKEYADTFLQHEQRQEGESVGAA